MRESDVIMTAVAVVAAVIDVQLKIENAGDHANDMEENETTAEDVSRISL